jgi:CBS domain-containing protein
MSLEAVALDIETTGLDARSARVIEIAALRVRGMKIASDEAFRHFVNPHCPIPASASLVHGLTEKDLREAPEFLHLAPDLETVIGDAVVIGHNIGYDLAVIDREYARASLTWKVPRFLDVRALARAADPHLANYELPALCDWLGVDITKRHRAFPDALAAALIFIGLVPRLRACGIRTLAEAEAASRTLPGEERLYQIGGWISPAQASTANLAPSIAAIDSYPYRHRLRDLAWQQPIFLDPTADVGAAARLLSKGNPAGILISRTPGGEAGFLAPGDILTLLCRSPNPTEKLCQAKFHPLPVMDQDDFLYRALGRMSRLGSPYIGIADRGGAIVGFLSATDLMRHRATSALIMGDEFEAASSVPDLGRAWAKLPGVVSSLLQEGVEAHEIAAVISAQIRVLTDMAARLAEARMRAEGKGEAPCDYALLVLGSAGRGESLLSADQDNAIIYATGEPDGPEDVWFANAGAHIAEILHEVGVPYCPGGVMAKNPGCRHSLRIWKDVVSDWTDRSSPKDALASDIFFDGVPVHGDLQLANELFAHAFIRARHSPLFIAALARFAQGWLPPISLLGSLEVDKSGRIDLKKHGLLPLATATRALALKYGIRPTATIERLRELRARALADAGILDRASSALTRLMNHVLLQQVKDLQRGVAPSTRVEITAIDRPGRHELANAMRAVSDLVGLTLAL